MSASLARIMPLQYWFQIKPEECRIFLDGRSIFSQCLLPSQELCHCNTDPNSNWKNAEFSWTVAAVSRNVCFPCKNYATAILTRIQAGRMQNAPGRSQQFLPMSASLATIMPLQYWPGTKLEECWILLDGRSISSQCLLPSQQLCHCNTDPKLS